MIGKLDGKTAVITGATRGFGHELANAFGNAGARLVVTSRSAEAVQTTLLELSDLGFVATGMACDVAQADQMDALASFATENYGGFDIWINNAGLSAPYGPSVHIQRDEFRDVLNTNILGVYYGSMAAMQHFLPRRQGILINITGRGDRGPQPMQNAYASSKAWMRSFTEALAREYQNSGVGIYAFNPGMMRTDMTQKVTVIKGYEDRLGVLDTVLRILSVSPADSAQTAVQLASTALGGRSHVFVRQMTPMTMVFGLLRELWRRVSGHPLETSQVQIMVVPPAIELL